MELATDTGAESRTVALPPAALEVYKQEECAKFLATASADGVPNVALIVSQMPVAPGIVVFGEFMMVKTQANLAENPKVASIAITEKLDIAGFKGDVTGWTTTGEYIDMINSIPFFRYNAYAGIHNVATTEIREILELPTKVSMLTVAREFATVRTLGRIGHAKSLGGVATPAPIRDKFDSIMSVKVLAYMDDDGYPNAVPVFGVMFRTPGELRFKVSHYNIAASKLKVPCTVALNVLTMDLMTYQVKGTLVRFEKVAGLETGVVKIEEAYSCVPPLVGQRVA
ncbi:MAG: pyridoxamine 5'-phosphate oxidase family protein [Candidatus Geothermincolia bacterium]